LIPVVQQPEPTNFDAKVRIPGTAFLNTHADDDKIDFTNAAYWKRISLYFSRSYGSVCAYTCHWIPLDVGSETIEHFRPKKLFPELAYEWSNYRLVCGRMNGRKREFEDVLDPFALEAETFHLTFPSLLIAPNPAKLAAIFNQAEATIKRLKLNDERSVLARSHWVEVYCQLGSLPHLTRHAPFIAYELSRQNIDLEMLQQAMEY
jgi:hypothetical protein